MCFPNDLYRSADVWKGFLLGGVFLCGCGGSSPDVPIEKRVDLPRVDARRAYAEVERFVDLGPRESGTRGAPKAAEYLLSRLHTLGVNSHIDGFTNKTPKGDVVFRNVIGRLPGSAPGLIILASHYDTKSGIDTNFVGANDSGSSSGLVLELARVLAASGSPGPEIQFAFFDGEECAVRYGPLDGLHGSRHMAQQLVASGRAKQVLAVIVLDMIGDRDLTVTLPRNSTPALVSAVLQAAHAEEVRSTFALWKYGIGDDHVPFLEAGMPAIDIIDFLYGSSPGKNDYWHTPEDTMDKISAESLELIGNVVLRTLWDLARVSHFGVDENR